MIATVAAALFMQAPQRFELLDAFDRNIHERGVVLIDWEGEIANPAIKLKVNPLPGLYLPAQVKLSANNVRIMFNLFSETSEIGPLKTMYIEDHKPIEFYMSIFGDRDSEDETHELSIEITDANEHVRTLKVPIKVIDQDGRSAPNFKVEIDFSHDRTGLFDDQVARNIVIQAASDWAYFLDGSQQSKVEIGEWKSWIWEADGDFRAGFESSNQRVFDGFYLFVHGIRNPEGRSGAMASDRQPNDGLARAGTVSMEVSGNWNKLGWFMSNSNEEWWKSGNQSRERHDFYSVVRHEMGHSLVYHRVHQNFLARLQDGRFVSEDVRNYLGRYPVVNEVEHFIDTVDPVSLVGAFGNEYGGQMPRRRWQLTKFDLLIAKSIGYRLRETTPFIPMTVTMPDVVEVTTGKPFRFAPKIEGGIPTYSVSGTGPNEITIEPWTGELSGVIQASGDVRIRMTFKDQDPTSTPISKEVVLRAR
ncbi:MAG: hypothetical protein KIT74_07665 [Fimbriimonadales bacterium]|nr:hypothetical protein [Fimbriimonadales bacterium]